MLWRVRLSRHADAALLPAIERSAGEAFRAVAGMEWIADTAAAPAETHLAAIGAGTSWVAVDPADRPIGFLSAVQDGAALHIEELSVQHGRQRSGCGRALIAAAILWAQAHDLAHVTLTTFRDVPWNAPFYRRLGFRTLAGSDAGAGLGAAFRAEIGRGAPRRERCAMRLNLDRPRLAPIGWTKAPAV